MIILQNATAVRTGMSTRFQGSGGATPYTYAVLSGGVGGTIADDGIYTAPSAVGVDTVQVTDSLGTTETAEILVGTPLELLCDVIQHELGLPAGRVYLWDQKFTVPKDSELYVAVSVVSCKPFGNNIRFNGDESGLEGVQSANFVTVLDVDIYSRSAEARNRKEQVVLALSSLYSLQQQESNSFRIFPVTDAFKNISVEDGPAIPYRFSIGVTIQYAVTRTQAASYFNDFEEPEILTDP